MGGSNFKPPALPEVVDYIKNSTNKSLQAHKLLKAECGHYLGAKAHKDNCRATLGHSECRALRAIMKLPENTFVDILPAEYQNELLFSELHFISYWDACSEFSITHLGNRMHGCSVMLFQAINMIKAKFNIPNLFVFYHSAFWYPKARYSVRVNGSIKDAKYKSSKFIVEHEEDDEQASPPEYKIKYLLDLNLGNDIPNFYIGL